MATSSTEPAQTTEPSEGHAGTLPLLERRKSRPILIVAIVLVAVWGISLFTMVVTTANPQRLHYLQIRQSDAVLQATLLDAESGRFRVVRSWKGDLQPGVVTEISNLPENGLTANAEYLVPVTRSRTGRWRVTQAVLPQSVEDELEGRRPPITPPLVYDATPAAIAQLEQLLDEIEQSSKPSP